MTGYDLGQECVVRLSGAVRQGCAAAHDCEVRDACGVMGCKSDQQGWPRAVHRSRGVELWAMEVIKAPDP